MTAGRKRNLGWRDFTLPESADCPKPVVAAGKKGCTSLALLNKNAIETELFNVPVDNRRDKDKVEDTNTPCKKIRASLKPKDIKQREDLTGRNNSFDVWHLIGPFIAPEDIGIFSAICTSAFKVTTLKKFWKNIYIKYCKPVKDSLPHHLQPDNIFKSEDGIRTRVICALHLVYPPFQKRNRRVNIRAPWEDVDSHGIVGAKLVEYFPIRLHEDTNYHYHYLKFKHMLNSTPVESLLIWHNPYEGEIGLRIALQSSKTYDFRSFINLQLVSIHLDNVCHTSSSCIKLIFEENVDGERIVTAKHICHFDHIQLIDWWHPSFHTQTRVADHWDAEM